MANLIKSSFVWQFVAGFALGAIGLAAAHAETPKDSGRQSAPTYVAR